MQTKTNTPHFYSAPGKTFLLGEYAILSGLPAVIATHGPRFEMTASLRTEETDETEWKLSTFHPKSPISRLLDWASQCGLPELSLLFRDPYILGNSGAPGTPSGGFGASSAQFALVYLTYAGLANWDRKWQSVWKLYRELTSLPTLPPSGADLAAQWKGGINLFNLNKKESMDLWPLLDWSNFLIFSASGQELQQGTGNIKRKTATHEHLDELAQKGFPAPSLISELEKPLKEGISALHSADYEKLGQAFTAYANTLWKAGLESSETHEDRRALSEFSDVLGVKGSGAMQADSVVVLLRPRSLEREKIIETAEKRGLILVSDGLQNELGVRQNFTNNQLNTIRLQGRWEAPETHSSPSLL